MRSTSATFVHRPGMTHTVRWGGKESGDGRNTRGSIGDGMETIANEFFFGGGEGGINNGETGLGR